MPIPISKKRLTMRAPKNQSPSSVDTFANTADDEAIVYVRSIFISDLHLGSTGCQAEHLLRFLKHYRSDYLFLVGDIIDGWQLKRTWYWPQAHNDVVQKVLRHARKGTKVYFIPGNHDEFARKYIGFTFGDIEVVEDFVHHTATGQKIWITHGDYFDGVVQHARWIAYVGDVAYETVLKVNSVLNRWRSKVGLPYWSLSQYLKYKVKKAVSYIDDFEMAVAKEAKKRGADMVLCGHIHHAEIRTVGDVTYLNDGDWVESLTAIVELHTGDLELVDWKVEMAQLKEQL